MRAIVVETNGGADELREADVPRPTAGAGELLVDVAFAGVNYRDIYDREGRTPAPFVVGVEGVGRIVEVGPSVSTFSIGDRVAWATSPGSYAESVIVKAERAVAVPDSITDEFAAAVSLQGLTAHYLCTSAYAVQPGDPVLIHAGAGGVGLLLTQIVRRLGGRVIVTVSSDEKADVARAAGAEHVLGYDGFATAVKELTDGEGVAAVFDGVGKTTFDESISALRRRGMVLSYGWASGGVPPFDIDRLSRGSLMVARVSMATYVTPGDWLQGRAADLFEWIGAGELRVHIDATYDLADAGAAHRRLESRRSMGKLLLKP
jgi:NADPH2:quinone reductase